MMPVRPVSVDLAIFANHLADFGFTVDLRRIDLAVSDPLGTAPNPIVGLAGNGCPPKVRGTHDRSVRRQAAAISRARTREGNGEQCIGEVGLRLRLVHLAQPSDINFLVTAWLQARGLVRMVVTWARPIGPTGPVCAIRTRERRCTRYCPRRVGGEPRRTE